MRNDFDLSGMLRHVRQVCNTPHLDVAQEIKPGCVLQTLLATRATSIVGLEVGQLLCLELRELRLIVGRSGVHVICSRRSPCVGVEFR